MSTMRFAYFAGILAGMFRVLSALLILGPLLAGCATPPRRAGASVQIEAPHGPDWQAIASPADQALIAALDTTWATARAAAKGRTAKRMASEGALLDSRAALDLPAMSPGSYRCRLVRIGGRRGYATYAPDFCYVDGDGKGVSLTKQTGENLPGGWLHVDSDRRLVFLGTFRTPGESAAPPYGGTPARDVAGVVERVGPQRWRLVLTKAQKGALLDIYELVPIAPAMATP